LFSVLFSRIFCRTFFSPVFLSSSTQCWLVVFSTTSTLFPLLFYPVFFSVLLIFVLFSRSFFYLFPVFVSRTFFPVVFFLSTCYCGIMLRQT
jgi:hypothetical protein